MTPETFLEAVRRRCGNFSCGTVWWCEESLWMEKLPPYYQPKFPGHPALSVWLSEYRRHLDAVPMLYGTRSKGRHIAVVARDLSPPSEKYPSGTRTYFGHFGPVQMELHEFTVGDATASQYAPGALDLTAWFDSARLWKNEYKDRLNDLEFAELQSWMQQNGWKS